MKTYIQLYLAGGVWIGEVQIKLTRLTSGRATLGIDAPDSMAIRRSEAPDHVPADRKEADVES